MAGGGFHGSDWRTGPHALSMEGYQEGMSRYWGEVNPSYEKGMDEGDNWRREIPQYKDERQHSGYGGEGRQHSGYGGEGRQHSGYGGDSRRYNGYSGDSRQYSRYDGDGKNKAYRDVDTESIDLQPDYEDLPDNANGFHDSRDGPGRMQNRDIGDQQNEYYSEGRIPEQNKAFDNEGFQREDNGDADARPEVFSRRNRSLYRKHSQKRSTGVSYTDHLQTIVQRRKQARTNISELGFSGRKSVINNHYDDLNDDFDDRLPSNRNKRTKSLKNRLNTLKHDREDLSTHDQAAALRDTTRDKILSHQDSGFGYEQKKYQLAKKFSSFKNWAKSWIYQLELWSGAFKVIEGHFGTSTVSYFRFLRWLMFLNLSLTVFMMFVVLVPFLTVGVGGDGANSFTDSVNSCTSKYHYEAIYHSTNYTSSFEVKNTSKVSTQSFVDVLQGTGWMENTVLFYGAYFNRTTFSETPFVYNMALAYLCAVGVGYLISFVLLVKNSANGMKESVLTSTSGGMSLYCNKVFGAWDYCIVRKKTAKLKHKSVWQEIQNELEYQRLQWKKESRTTREKVKLYVIRVLINLLVLAILGGALYLIYFTNEKLAELQHRTDLNKTVKLVLEFLPSITITLLSVIVPTIFNKLVTAEDYMPAFAIRITLIRTVLLRLSSVGILMISLYATLKGLAPSLDVSPFYQASCGVSTAPTNMSDPEGNWTQVNNETESTDKKPNIKCWETYVGQQIYKLVFLNFIVVIAVTFVWEFPRKLMYKKFHKRFKLVNLLGLQEFDLSKSVLDLVYLQTLCWIGMFFSPIIPGMCLITCFIFFYIKKASLLTNCIPTQQYGTSKSNSLFMMVLLLSFFLAIIPISYMVGKLHPSQGCGPFRVYSRDNYIMFDVVSNMVDEWPSKARSTFYFMGTAGFMAVMGLLLCMLMYYFWLVGQAHHKMSKGLREQLKVEGQDKQFLVARLHETFEIMKLHR
ncbi:hypothetical protein DPMN_034306 [Dreissena polymorpha]|uniref:TMC domain-containing protein n=1 Tax=Dreissena polymorpha TaxID=45954 RepID=A0A9D4RLU6_DREPO|nr:hypothetical protein DPMN_034306 [Dreissena polymorpha]